MLYKIRDGVSVFEDNPELFAIPEFSALYSNVGWMDESMRDRRMRFTILVADRKSPLKGLLLEKQRREKAALICGWKLEKDRPDRNARDLINGKVEVVEKAIAKYKELQPDTNRESYEKIVKLIQNNRDYIDWIEDNKTELGKNYGKELERANKLGKQLVELEESKKKLEEILQINDDYKPEITTYSSMDIPEETLNSEEELNAIEIFHRQNQRINDQ